VTTNIGYISSYFLQIKMQTNFLDFREATVSTNSVDSIPVLWRPRATAPVVSL
jgi:hypothetical protein